jgi:hypothetical protein
MHGASPHNFIGQTNTDFAQLSTIATNLQTQYPLPAVNPWEGSPFQWIQTRNSKQKGAIGESFVKEWAISQGFTVAKSPGSESDCIINGWLIEIKYSNLWTATNTYRFSQIRNQGYDFCFCLGLSPSDVHAWIIPKHMLMTNRKPSLGPQHNGVNGVDTRWLSFPSTDAPIWLQPYGGTPTQVKQLILAKGIGPHA